jgi:hypothetical protein
VSSVAEVISKIYAPLSYGEQDYREKLLENIPQIYREKLIPLKTFLPFAEYAKIMGECAYVAMGSIRQQAFGNIAYALAIGARVFLDERSPIYSQLRSLGMVVFAMQELVEAIAQRKGWLDRADIEKNRALLEQHYGWQIAVDKTRRMISEIRRDVAAFGR